VAPDESTQRRAAIKLAGRDPVVAGNRIRFEPNVVRTTSGGLWMDAFTNGNRAIEVRGWGWTIADNDYEVHSNYAPDGRKYNDGEGIMHEAWQNVGVRGSRLVGNVGNRYLCFWRVPARDLLIAENKIRIAPGFHAIYVNSQARYPENRFVDLPVARVVVRGNRTEGSGISVYGEGLGGNRIEANRHRARPGDTPLLRNLVEAVVDGNRGYRVETVRGEGP